VSTPHLPTIDAVAARYGAPMGRSEWRGSPAAPVRLFHVPIDAGGYDPGGAYWGPGLRLYCATDALDFRVFVRARDRACAMSQVLKARPGLTFARGEVTA